MLRVSNLKSIPCYSRYFREIRIEFNFHASVGNFHASMWNFVPVYEFTCAYSFDKKKACG